MRARRPAADVLADPLVTSAIDSPGTVASGRAIRPGETGRSGAVGSAFARASSLADFAGTALAAGLAVSKAAGSRARYPLRARTFVPGRATVTSIARYLPSNTLLVAV